jgi:TetR/AcrR family transcriptional regulator
MTSRRQAVKRPPGRPVARFEGETRELLLAAATRLFAEHGVAATTFTRIAQCAGLTPAVVHYYFSDRGALIDAVVDERLVPLIASVWDPVKPQEPAAVVLRGVVERLLEAIGHNPWVPSTWMREVLNEDGLLRSRVSRRLPLEKVRLLAAAMVRGQKQGTVHADLDPVLIVFSTLGLVMLHWATARFFAEIFHRDVPDRRTLERHITGVLLHGVERPKKGKPHKAICGR